jgi:Mg-chelatase subunit ChlD
VFNTGFAVIPECTAATVEKVYATIEPNGSTDLVDPLVDGLNNAFAKHQSDKHPVIIVVIADGLPNVPRNPKVVNQALIEFTRRMHNEDQVVVKK